LGGERAGVLLTVYQNRRFDADLLTVRAVIDSGELGRVIRFESRIEQFTPPGGITATGGGILLDLGAHVFDQALLLCTLAPRPGPGPVNAGTGRCSTPVSPMRYAVKVPCRSTPGTPCRPWRS